MTFKERLAQLERVNEATRKRPPAATPEQIAEIRRKVEESKDHPRQFEVERVDRPYLDEVVYKGRWVVHVVTTDGVLVRPTDKIFTSEEEANAYYEEMKAA